MAEVFAAPNGVSAKGGDGCAIMSWQSVKGADGYLLRFYRDGKLIKRRYAQRNSKTVLGFKNGTEYSVSVTAFRRSPDGTEHNGEESGRAPFIPICEKLKAQSVICMETGEKARITPEYKNTVPDAKFTSLDPDTVSVDESGGLTALKKGYAVIRTESEGESVLTDVYVERSARNDGDAVLLFGGDIMCALTHQRIAKNFSYDFSGCFDGTADVIKSADFSAAVLESVCCDGAPYEHEQKRLDAGSPNCNSPSSFLDAVKDAGFSALITANNHILDAGEDGLSDTVSNIKKRGIFNIGTGGDCPVLIHIKGITVGFAAANLISNGTDDSPEKQQLAGSYDSAAFAEKIRQAREAGAQFIITCLHWGTMNSRQVRPSQLTAAREIAEAGADMIIGSHPHVIQKYELISTSDGRTVPCAYSLGNLFTSMNELEENRDGVLLKLRLSKKKDGGLSGRICFIPTYCTDCVKGVRIDPCVPAVNGRFEKSALRVKKALGSAAAFSDKPLMLLQGSAVLRNIFGGGEFSTDGAGLIISQLAAVGNGREDCADTESVRTKLEVRKDLARYASYSKAEYIVTDFYTAASLSCYKLGDELYTASQGFEASDFFKRHKDEFELLRPPFDRQLVRERIRRYAQLLTSVFPSEKIVLVRLCFSDMAVTHGQLRNTSRHDALNKRIKEMEELFISYADPIVIDVAGQYFADCSADNRPSSFEPYFYRHVKKLISRIQNGENRRYYSEPDGALWLERIVNCYDNMTARGYQNRLLDDSAADRIIRYSSKEFIEKHADALIKLKRLPDVDLPHAAELFKYDGEFSAAALAIDALLHADTDLPYETVKVVFDRKLNALKLLCDALGKKIGCKVVPETAEEVFLRQNSPDELKSYFSNLPHVKADIWGSCVTRETVNRNRGGIEVGRYIFKQPQVLAYEPPINCILPESLDKYCNNKWRQRTVFESFSHAGAALLSESRSPWLLVDLYDLICTMCEYKGGLFETDDFIKRCDFYRELESELTDTYLFKSRSEEYCDRGMERFAALVSKIYGKNIILIRVDLKDSYIDLDGGISKLPEDKELETKRRFLKRYEDMFASLTDCAVIDTAKDYRADDRFPLGGAHIAHYEDGFYAASCERINEIIFGQS